MASATEASDQANRAGLDPKRLVVIFFLLSGIVLALFFSNVLATLFARLQWNNPPILEGLAEWRLTSLLGVVLAAALAIGLYVAPKTHALSMETATELMKVTWPTWAETRVSTTAVVVASVVASLVLFSIDTIALEVMVEWLPKVWGKL